VVTGLIAALAKLGFGLGLAADDDVCDGSQSDPSLNAGCRTAAKLVARRLNERDCVLNGTRAANEGLSCV
jgi:hypothetical protein